MKNLPKAYNPQEVEEKIYKKWEESGYFNPDICVSKGVCKADAKPFSMVLPPPNVTGTLHIGHAVMLALEDVMIRYHRMKGDKTLWLPGTDHAAIATQSKVESILYKEEKKTRHDLGREEFLQRVKKFAQKSHDTIVDQCKKMGASLDWSREAFTLDEKREHAVRIAFKHMYEAGLIYQGNRIVNWDPELQTTVSDDELVYEQTTDALYFFQYGPFVIATARPETKFGDKYVVMHPDDERYKKYKHGEQLNLEWINGPITATIIKDSVIDMEFGSGVMTITPWHDVTDFEIAQRHGLEKQQIIDYDGKLLPVAGEFSGMHIDEARPKIVEKLQSKGLVVKVDHTYTHNIAHNDRGGGRIEPQIKKQWFIDVHKEFEQDGKNVTLKTLLHDAVSSGDITILPKRFEKTYFHWINNLRDWCISRQIWYGHQIPVWYRGSEVFCGTQAPKGDGWTQDSDTLDTWFSSGLWTFSTLGWPEQTNDLQTFHPTDVLETGYDIIFFWVARMILMTRFLLKKNPFHHVYLHGLVRDEQGRKMSKSLGNIIDPLDVIDKYGTDAVRLSLMIGSTPGSDTRLSDEKVAGYRNFSNKLWNIARFILTTCDFTSRALEIHKEKLTLADTWILHQLAFTQERVTQAIEQYQFSLAGEVLREFTWNQLADWYLEIAKVEGTKAPILAHILCDLLKLWHPLIPFVTEEIYSHLPKHLRSREFLMIESWPEEKREFLNEEAVEEFRMLQEVITAIRNLRSENKVAPKELIEVSLYPSKRRKTLEEGSEIIKRLARVATLNFLQAEPTGVDAFGVITSCATVLLSKETKEKLFGSGALHTEEEKKRNEQEMQKLRAYKDLLEAKLANTDFLTHAPKHIVDTERKKLQEAESKYEQLQKFSQ